MGRGGEREKRMYLHVRTCSTVPAFVPSNLTLMQQLRHRWAQHKFPAHLQKDGIVEDGVTVKRKTSLLMCIHHESKRAVESILLLATGLEPLR